MIANISSSVISTRRHNRNPNISHRNGIWLSTVHNYSPTLPLCGCCKCSNRVLTCVVITIIPIAITSTLICIFMMQKTNLHVYAIYSFVVFCVAFVFPFVLFFVTVILNKIYNLYKRENDNSFIDCELHHQHVQPNNDSNELMANNRVSRSPSPLTISTLRDLNTDYFGQRVVSIPAYYLTVDCSEFSDQLTNNLTNETQLIIEDNPPSYEMALLCSTISLNEQFNDANLNSELSTDSHPPPPPYTEKVT